MLVPDFIKVAVPVHNCHQFLISRNITVPGTLVAYIGRILQLRHNEMEGRIFKILMQELRTENPKSINKGVTPIFLSKRTGEMTLQQRIDREELCKDTEECFIYVKVYKMKRVKGL